MGNLYRDHDIVSCGESSKVHSEELFDFNDYIASPKGTTFMKDMLMNKDSVDEYSHDAHTKSKPAMVKIDRPNDSVKKRFKQSHVDNDCKYLEWIMHKKAIELSGLNIRIIKLMKLGKEMLVIV